MFHAKTAKRTSDFLRVFRGDFAPLRETYFKLTHYVGSGIK